MGLSTAAIYAVVGSGLVLTYATTGVFNFAHGAAGMLAAFFYWQLTIGWGWPVPAALAVVLLVAAPRRVRRGHRAPALAPPLRQRAASPVMPTAPASPVTRATSAPRAARALTGRALTDRALTGRPLTDRALTARPLAGALVVDFSALWAGSLCAHLLGLAGSRVVKVETPWRPDGARRGNAAFYDLLHAGHRCVALDPDTSSGREAMAALVDAADIVIESSRPRALARFGLDAGAAVARGTTWVSITAYGRPSDRIGFGDDVAAASGLVARDARGYPVFCGDAIADPLTGLTAAVRAACAPAGGALLDIAMADVVAATVVTATPDPAPAPPAARRDAGGWVVDTAAGPVRVAQPRRRQARGSAARPGEHTDESCVNWGSARGERRAVRTVAPLRRRGRPSPRPARLPR